jgi:hypothetical protein
MCAWHGSPLESTALSAQSPMAFDSAIDQLTVLRHDSRPTIPANKATRTPSAELTGRKQR